MAALLGASLVFGGVAAGVVSIAPSAVAQDVTTLDVGSGDTATVNANALNVRQTPSLSGTILTTLSFGTQVSVVTGPVVADGYTWYRLQQNGTFIGWAVTNFLTETTDGGDSDSGNTSGEFAVGDSVTVNTDLLNVRSAPSISASVLATYAFGRTAAITGGPTNADGYAWYAVDNYGWVAGQFLTAGGSTPAPGPGTPTGDFAVGDDVFVDADVVNVRSGPGLGNAATYTATYGDTFTILEGPVVADGYEWYRVSNLVSAWIAGDFLSSGSGSNPSTPGDGSGSFVYGQTVSVNTDLLNVRSAPTTSASVLSVYGYGRSATITGGPTSADGYTWYAVDNYGWVAGPRFSITEPPARSVRPRWLWSLPVCSPGSARPVPVVLLNITRSPAPVAEALETTRITIRTTTQTTTTRITIRTTTQTTTTRITIRTTTIRTIARVISPATGRRRSATARPSSSTPTGSTSGQHQRPVRRCSQSTAMARMRRSPAGRRTPTATPGTRSTTTAGSRGSFLSAGTSSGGSGNCSGNDSGSDNGNDNDSD